MQRLARDGRNVGSTPWLGHGEGTTNLAGSHAWQEVLLLLLGAVLHDHVRNDEVSVDHSADAHPTAGDLLDTQCVGRQGFAEAAVLLRNHDSEDAHLLETLNDVRRVLIGMLKSLRVGNDFVVYEVPDCGEDFLLNVGQTISLREASHRYSP